MKAVYEFKLCKRHPQYKELARSHRVIVKDGDKSYTVMTLDGRNLIKENISEQYISEAKVPYCYCCVLNVQESIVGNYTNTTVKVAIPRGDLLALEANTLRYIDNLRARFGRLLNITDVDYVDGVDLHAFVTMEFSHKTIKPYRPFSGWFDGDTVEPLF